MNGEGAVLPDPHAASLLGRETEQPVRRPRPKFRFYPGPIAFGFGFALFSALAAFGFLTFRASASPGFYNFIAVLAAITGIGAVVTLLRWLTFGVTLAPRELGVVMVSGNKQTTLRYADIDAITIVDLPRFDENRAVVAFNRTITLESNNVKARARYIAMPHDPLDAMLARVIANIAATAKPRSGDDWSIDDATLRWRGDAVPLALIAQAGIFDDQVRVWRRGEESPFLAVPMSSRNAHLLLHLTQHAASTSVPTTTVAQSVASDGTALGRLLFTRRTTITSVLVKLALIAGVLAVSMLAIDRVIPEFSRLGYGAIIAIAVLAWLNAMAQLTTRFHFHERGLVRKSLAGQRTMLYSAVTSLTWRETTNFINHISVGTTAKITFVTDDSRPLRMHVHRFRAVDDDIVPVRRAISLNIARALRTELERGERVRWTSDATFTHAGLEVKTGLLGHGTELLPYDHPIGMRFSEGYLVLYRDTWRNPLSVLNASAENFYPGLALFETLMQQVSVAETQAG